MHSEISYNLITEKWGGIPMHSGETQAECGRIPAAERRAVKRMRSGRRAKGRRAICTKCNASIPNGASSCPECKAKFEKHVGAFAGSVHWEDEVRIRESPRTKKAEDHRLQRDSRAGYRFLAAGADRRARRNHGGNRLAVRPHGLPGGSVRVCGFIPRPRLTACAGDRRRPREGSAAACPNGIEAKSKDAFLFKRRPYFFALFLVY